MDIDSSLKLKLVKEACRVLQHMREPRTYENVAKFIGIRKMDLIKFLDANIDMVEIQNVKINRTIKPVLAKVYTDISEKPNTPQWVERMRHENENTIRLNPKDNYGYIVGYDLVVDEGETAWCNTISKVQHIVTALGLQGPGWKYLVGGLGDSAVYKAPGYKVEEHQIKLIEQLGYRII